MENKMENTHFDFWKMAYDMNCVTAERLKGAVKTAKNPNGELSPEEYKIITGLDFTE